MMLQTSLVLISILMVGALATGWRARNNRVPVRQESVDAQLRWYQRQLRAGRISLGQYQAIRRELLR